MRAKSCRCRRIWIPSRNCSAHRALTQCVRDGLPSPGPSVPHSIMMMVMFIYSTSVFLSYLTFPPHMHLIYTDSLARSQAGSAVARSRACPRPLPTMGSPWPPNSLHNSTQEPSIAHLHLTPSASAHHPTPNPQHLQPQLTALNSTPLNSTNSDEPNQTNPTQPTPPLHPAPPPLPSLVTPVLLARTPTIASTRTRPTCT